MKAIPTLCCCLLISAALQAQPGSLDNSFGESGKVISKYFGNCYSMQVQQDDKIVCAGINNYKIQAVRYLADGTLDSSFGNNGIFYPNIPETNPQITSMVLQPDQKIILSSDGYKNGVPTIVLMRLLPDGSFDKSFGNNGIIDSTFGIGESFPHIALQPDEKILVLGGYYPGFIVIRYSSNGSIDESFGDKGKVLTTFGASAIPTAIAVSPDGKIVTAGNYGGGVGYSKFLLACYTAEGTLNESFGNKGVTTTDFGKYGDLINDMIIQPDGKIVVAGNTGIRDIGDNENMAIARYTTNGLLDMQFGNQGKTTVVYNGLNSLVTHLLLQSNGEIILIGGTYLPLYYGFVDFALSRLNENGLIDSTFGNEGIVTTDFGLYERAYAGSIQKNGKIIAAGVSFIQNDNPQINYALARYNNDGSRKQIIITKIKRWLQHRNGFTWDANNSINSYVVQRSYDGIHFSSVAKINTVNASNVYADPLPLSGSNYYRLQTTSVDGAVNYSNVIAVMADGDAIKISPNPAKNVLQIQGLLSSTKAKLTVVDFSGNVAINQQLSGNNSSSFNLNIASLKPGNYLLKIEMNGEIVSKKFLKE